MTKSYKRSVTFWRKDEPESECIIEPARLKMKRVRRVRGSVTLVKSNAKALLTASYQKCSLQAGFALSEGQEQLFEKSYLHPAKTLSVTIRVDVTVFFTPPPSQIHRHHRHTPSRCSKVKVTFRPS